MHDYYDEAYVMYVVVGHSASLTYVMDEHLNDEIERGLVWFMLSLVGGVAVCFIIFSCCFERRLQVKVTKPISELSKQIKNPKEFMAARNKSVDFYARKNTVVSRQQSIINRSSTLSRSEVKLNESVDTTNASLNGS